MLRNAARSSGSGRLTWCSSFVAGLTALKVFVEVDWIHSPLTRIGCGVAIGLVETNVVLSAGLRCLLRTVPLRAPLRPEFWRFSAKASKGRPGGAGSRCGVVDSHFWVCQSVVM